MIERIKNNVLKRCMIFFLSKIGRVNNYIYKENYRWVDHCCFVYWTIV